MRAQSLVERFQRTQGNCLSYSERQVTKTKILIFFFLYDPTCNDFKWLRNAQVNPILNKDISKNFRHLKYFRHCCCFLHVTSFK